MQLLGIGTDGHIGFNEPSSALTSRTRVKTLTAQTRRDNARFFDGADAVPRHVLTQGLGTIGEARHLVMIAVGARKADAIAAAVEGPLTAFCPASIMQWHRHVTVVIDEAAAGALRLADYYATPSNTSRAGRASEELGAGRRTGSGGCSPGAAHSTP